MARGGCTFLSCSPRQASSRFDCHFRSLSQGLRHQRAKPDARIVLAHMPLCTCDCSRSLLPGRQAWRGPLRSATYPRDIHSWLDSTKYPLQWPLFGKSDGLVLKRSLRVHARGLPDLEDQNREAIDARARVRSEVLAPFRLVRLVLYGFFTLSASVALAIALTQLAAAVAKAPNALPLQGTLQGIAIDAGAIVILLLLFRSDWKARQKQIARLTREETLGSLQLELSNKKSVRLSQLRRFARPVLVAGTPKQVEAAVAEAEPLREELEERGVFVVPLPVFSAEGQGQPPALEEKDLKFKGLALRQSSWKSWFEEQLKMANATADKGLYISLRLDGRVRASGTGSPPWQRLVRELPPNSGAFQGILDGMDGKVNAWK